MSLIIFPLSFYGKSLTIERLLSKPALLGTQPESIQWSPDGTLCAFLWDDKGERNYKIFFFRSADPIARKAASNDFGSIQEYCWGRTNDEIIFLKGNAVFLMKLPDGGCTEIIAGSRPKKTLACSPSGLFLAYVQEGDLWIYNFLTQETRPLTSFDAINVFHAINGIEAGSESPDKSVLLFRWSPDSRQIAFLYQDIRQDRRVRIPIVEPEGWFLREAGFAFTGDQFSMKQVGIVNIKDGNIEWLDLNSRDALSFEWSPSGRRLLVETSSEYTSKRDLFIRENSNGKLTSVYSETDPLNNTTELWRSEWIRDHLIVFLSDKDGFNHIYTLDVDSQRERRITGGNWEVLDIAAVRGEEIYFIRNAYRSENRTLFRVSIKKTAVERVVNRDGVIKPFISHQKDAVCFLFSDDQTPYDLYYLAGKKMRRVTSSPLAEFYEYDWAKTEYRDIPSRQDGKRLRIKLQFPPGFDPKKSYPAIIGSVYSNTVVNQWGGRIFHQPWALDQFLVQEKKCVVMNIDIRGSVGHGKEFRDLLVKGYGTIDVDDLISGAEYLKSFAGVDKNRIAIWGSSYGGLLTLIAMFKYPHMFACGIAGAPVSNLDHALGGVEDVMKSPDDRESYEKGSALFWSQGLEDPLMIIHGLRDTIVLFMDTMILVRKMIAEGKEFELVTLPDTAHLWDPPLSRQTIFSYNKMIDFFSRHLKLND